MQEKIRDGADDIARASLPMTTPKRQYRTLIVAPTDHSELLGPRSTRDTGASRDAR